MDNTSGLGKSAAIPAEIDRWSWGAFLLNWIWGIGNNTFIALLMLVPLVNIVMLFILGAKGNVWAWRNKRWDSVEQFKRVQRKWAFWGVVIYILFALFALSSIFLTFYFIKSSDAYQLALQRVQTHPAAVQVLGTPIDAGWSVSGNVQVSGSSGEASFSFPVSGPKASGEVYVDATKEMGAWHINRQVLKIEKTGEQIELTERSPQAAAPAPAAPSAAPAQPPSVAPAPQAAAPAAAATPAPPAPEAAPAAQAAAPAPAAPAAAPPALQAAAKSALATSDGAKPGSRVEVQELKRVSGGTVMLRFTMINDADTSLNVGYDFGAGSTGDVSTVAGVHLIEPVGKKKYLVVRDTENKCDCSRGVRDVAAKSRANLWARFPAPPDNVEKITVIVPHFSPMDDVPISR